MISRRRLLYGSLCAALFVESTLNATPVKASIALSLVNGGDASRPIVRASITNRSRQPILVGLSSVFDDYDVRVEDERHRPAPLTEVGRNIRNHVPPNAWMRAILVTLRQNETSHDDLDVRRYFELTSGELYNVRLSRVLAGSKRRIRSNVLRIRVG
jgi:hypothetical protein